MLPLDLEIQIKTCIGEIKRGKNAQFIDEQINPNTFDTPAHCKLYLKLKAIGIWQERWESTTKGRITFNFFPDVANRMDGPPLKLTHHKTQILTGHGNFGVHLHRIGKQDEPLCPICDEIDDPIHRILECPKFENARTRLRNIIDHWPREIARLPYFNDKDFFVMLTSDNPELDPNPENDNR